RHPLRAAADARPQARPGVSRHRRSHLAPHRGRGRRGRHARAGRRMSVPASAQRRSFYQRHEAAILGGGSMALILGIWEAAWQAKLISPLFFSGPSAIVTQMIYSWTRGNLKSDLVYSGTNFLLGFAGAVVAGVAVGIVVGWYRPVRLLANPILNALYATP